ncbi:MAG: selenoprotein O, partial [Hyphococcus sp.]
GDTYQEALAGAVFRRLGLKRAGAEDFAFVADLLRWMTETDAPYEQVFFDWFGGAASAARADASPEAALYARDDFKPVRERLCAVAPDGDRRLAHRYFQRARPCTMLIDEVEAIWAPIAEQDDWSAFDAKLQDIAQMRDAYGFDASVYAAPDRK